MPPFVAMGASLQCTFGASPSSMVVTPEKGVMGNKMAIANIMDNVPMKNVMPFVMCSSLANPTVAAATTAALGVLTPMPCVPVIAAPWAPGHPKALIKKMPVLNATSKCACNWGGVIQVVSPGQTNAAHK